MAVVTEDKYMKMRKIMLVFLFAVLGATVAHAADVTVDGSYVWKRRKGEYKGTFKAVFTPVSEGKWKVVFNFKYKDKPYRYTGTATGSLQNGTLKGTVLNDDKKRTFTFIGTVKDGKMTGTHKEIKKRGSKKIEIDTGTLAW